ncbi:hypothetical protein ACIPXV_16730 [Streptomyces libani]|uniref:hypothetical protein n=1 Tax=Streptomyces nigrescens TaxID=1920 RepID=UPI003821CAB8
MAERPVRVWPDGDPGASATATGPSPPGPAHRRRRRAAETLTDGGQAAKGRIKSLIDGLRSQIHEGITDEEYAVALTVLQRMIRHVGGAAAPR